MIKKLILDDFLAHGHTELDLGPGVTVISGPNNSGKSSIVEALRCLAQNPSPKFFIRHGAREARVSAVLEDDTMVTWIRRPKYAMYEIVRSGEEEPVTYAKFGRKTPEDVLDLLRLDNVFLEGINEDVDVHLGDQRRPVFLLDRPGSAMASFFASSTEATHLVAMQQLLKTKMTQAKRDDRTLGQAMQRFAGVLDVLQPLPALRMEMDMARDKADQAGRVRAQVPELEARCKNLLGHAGEQKRLQNRQAVLSRTLSPPVPEPVDALSGCITRLLDLQKKADRLQTRLRTMTHLAPLPGVHPCKPLADLLKQRNVLRHLQDQKTNRYNALCSLKPAMDPVPTHALDQKAQRMMQLQVLAGRLKAKARVLEHVSPPHEPFETSALQKTVRLLTAFETQREHLAGKGDVLCVLGEPGQLADVHSLASLIRQIHDASTLKSTIRVRLEKYTIFPSQLELQSPASGERLLKHLVKQIRQVQAAQTKLARLILKEKNLHNRLNEIDICPLCGGHVDAERVLGMVKGRA